MYIRLDTVLALDGQTDRQTENIIALCMRRRADTQ